MTSKFSIDNRELLQRISSGEAVVGIDFGNLIVRELAAFRLAAMDSEPVAYIFKHPAGRLFWSLTDKSNKGHDDVMPVYASLQPAQVVPDEVTAEDYPAFVEYEVAEVDEAWSRGFNACRSAMLADATHDTPDLNSVQSVVTVPGKWIPVSERMPEVGVKVLCFPVKDEPIHATFNGQLWLQDVSWCGSEEPIDNVIPVTVTHWMELPAAPQEPKP